MRLLKLDIGGGRDKRDEDYTSVDIHGEPDVKAEMWALPFKDGEVDSIWSSHTLEHAPYGKIIETLKEWNRVLRPGGRLIVQVPDFNYVARYWLVGPDRRWAEAMVFGLQSTDGEYHKSAFTAETLEGDLKGSGFDVKRVELRQTHSQMTLQAVAVKLASKEN
jgi:predicted SAM-dependent methyltransferase